MKVYEKPKLIAMSLSKNNVLCNSCDIDIKDANMDPNYKDMIWNGLFSFASTEDQCVEAGNDIETDVYCKFTGSNILFDSQ